MHLVVKELFERGEFFIFTKADTDELCFKVNPDEDIDSEFSCQLFYFLGLVFGKALFERLTLDCYLDRCFLRILLNQPIQLSDIYGFDKQLYKGWTFLMNCEVEQLDELQLDFAVQRGGKTTWLAPEGTRVSIGNRQAYVQKCIEYFTFTIVRNQIQAFMKGFGKVIPLQLLGIFKPEELEMMMYGVPFVNVHDLKAHTVYKGEYNDGHPLILAFWMALLAAGQPQLRRFMQFLTGSERPPVFGCSRLESNRNTISHFCIQPVTFDPRNPYPKAHTCFNRLQLPMYRSPAQLNLYLEAVMQNNLEGVYGLD